MIALMLAKHPNLSVIDGESDDSVLQQTARQFSKAKSPEDRRKWQALIDMYKKAGADYDIVTAIRLNDFDRVKAILSKSPQVIHEPDSRSPLREAASEGRLEICRYLIERFHPDVNEFKQGSGYPIIKEALAYPEVVRLLIASGADLKKRMTFQGGRSGAWVVGDNATALHYAAEDGVPGTIQLLIDSGVDVFATTDSPFAQLTGNQDQTALDVAAIFGKAENVAAIIHHPKFQRADAKRRKELLDRCLACRRWYDHPFGPPDERWKLLETLLECGADPNTRVDGMTAIQRAAQQIWPSTDTDSPRALVRGARIDEIRKEIDVLRKHGAEIDLVSAVASGNEAEVARLLKQDPRSANSRRADGYPALHWAVAMDYEGIVKQLLDAGCDVDLRNQCSGIGTTGETALHAVASWGGIEIAKTLLAHGANVNTTSPGNQWTPLHEAVCVGDFRVARLLLQNGANPDAKDKSGNRPLDVYEPRTHHKAAIHAVFREYARTAKDAAPMASPARPHSRRASCQLAETDRCVRGARCATGFLKSIPRADGWRSGPCLAGTRLYESIGFSPRRHSTDMFRIPSGRQHKPAVSAKVAKAGDPSTAWTADRFGQSLRRVLGDVDGETPEYARGDARPLFGRVARLAGFLEIARPRFSRCSAAGEDSRRRGANPISLWRQPGSRRTDAGCHPLVRPRRPLRNRLVVARSGRVHELPHQSPHRRLDGKFRRRQGTPCAAHAPGRRAR